MNGNTSGEMLEEIVFGKAKYLYRTDSEHDYLIDNSNNKVKVNLRFTKNKDKNEIAINGLKTFFSGISS
ncbi:TPA: hypothetical protein ROY02_003806 [Bacillus cereus]|uniref:hypothetical protein n=1 Tax=Bacillus thuringiensis TaxID=1428 RepID=UPI000871E7A6|nr:hypothetical protein [Bacillus thuringiensis]HDR4913358.1 hypothetical protein [Bacillus cereus]OFC75043.1 hypothetical protein BTGOE1_46890 [Bacillus thuringiensis]OFC77677.1 hypothetical protein BTGOE2_47270 [Bacillus thuringiensis]HDR4918982.1 hypothetical protein [Bacillus cereus]HDX9617030.1 hypothetical protein [Bacillus thuringiensis]